MDPRGLVTYYILFIIHLSTRAVHIAGVTMAPNGAFMKQVARNLTDVSDGFLSNKEFLIMDRDTKYTDEFRGHLKREGVTEPPREFRRLVSLYMDSSIHATIHVLE